MEKRYQDLLQQLEATGNLRTLPHIRHEGKWVTADGRRLLNLSSNDYLGLSAESDLRKEFLNSTDPEELLFSASSSRLLTGNFGAYHRLEKELSGLFGTESVLVFNSGYHMNTGILPAVADSQTLILADKLVHASLIDGIRLSPARCIRYRHHDYRQLEQLIQKHHASFSQLIIVTESIFSMDGDVTPLPLLADLKRRYPNVLLYVDEAHAFGVRGKKGLGVAEETDCINDIDFLCGTFGKALASVGGYIACSQTVHDYLVNRMRTLIFTTALPPVNIAWTHFLVCRLPDWNERRAWLGQAASLLRKALQEKGYACPSESHIVPLTVGSSENAILKANEMQQKGFYVLPVRPPTVPEGTSRLRFSLTAAINPDELNELIRQL